MENFCLGKKIDVIFKKSTILNKKKTREDEKLRLEKQHAKEKWHKALKKPDTLDYISRLFIHSLSKNPEPNPSYKSTCM